MKRRATVALAAALVVGGLAGCDSTTEPAEVTVTETATVVETVTAEAKPAPKPTRTPRPEPTTEPAITDDEINALALEIVWNGLTASEQSDACLGLSLDEDMMIDAFMEGAGPDFDRKQVRDFFREKC